jgi:hypothetical protein
MKNYSATIRFPDASSHLEAVVITAAPNRTRDVAKALLNLVPMSFSIVGKDPELKRIVESSDYNYNLVDRIKVTHKMELKSIQNQADTSVNPPSPPSVTFEFNYTQGQFFTLKSAVDELCAFLHANGVTLQVEMPPSPQEPVLQKFDKENSGFYAQTTVNQPYHTAAQVAAAAQGNYGMYAGNNHHQNIHNSQHGYVNGHHGANHGQHYGRNFQHGHAGNYGARGGGPNGRYTHPGHHPAYQQQGGYQSYHGNRPAGYPFQPQHGANGSSNTNGGVSYNSRRHTQFPPTNSMDPVQSAYSPIPQTGMPNAVPLDTFASGAMPLPDVPSRVNGNISSGYRPNAETHTPSPSTLYGSPIPGFHPPFPSNMSPNGQSTNSQPNGFQHAPGQPRYQ